MPKWDYPPAPRGSVVDDYHGTRVPDPYRWLEDDSSPETKAWVDAQNRLFRGFVDAGPLRDGIKARLERLENYPKISLPWKKGGRYFFHRNDGLQNHYVFHRMDRLGGEPKVVLDPNLLSEDGTVAVTGWHLSHDSSLLAYATSASGSDRQEMRIRRVDTGEEFPEILRHCKFTGAAWKHDNSGFYYNRYPAPGTVPPEDENRHCKLYWHASGTPQEEDVLVYERPDDPDLMFGPSITEDGRYLLLHLSRGTAPTNAVYYRPADSDGDFVRLLDEFDAGYWFVHNVGPVFYFNTDLDAPRRRVIAIDINAPEKTRWREVLPEREEPLSGCSIIDGKLVAVHMSDACDRAAVYSLDGGFIRSIELPAPGVFGGPVGRHDEPEMFYEFSSFIHPPTQYRYDMRTGKAEVFRECEVDVDPSRYETKQVFFASKDGTRVPMFLAHRKGLELDGSNPTLLYGYGGFQATMQPCFSAWTTVWYDAGGVFAMACLRGGCEYGEDWHRAGMFEKKQSVFDDFIAAGEWLIANGYTSNSRLAIEGGSNGGLLVAACMTQRPELFGAVVAAVPLTDMLRFHKFTVGHFWTTEYGNAEESAEQFRYIHAYSPYHRVKVGTAYPPTLVTTADTDDRVVSLHGKKFAAALQAADAGPGPVFIRIETKAGHGGGKPLGKMIDEEADTYAFKFRIFGMEVRDD